ncbi:hypothetical protein [Thalassospira aquimaris]|uniref:Minor tail protein n=1 Tax=Thalassospira aquimaris TaxID=3037796 RepID=A0ABT6GGL3_9PROT|nr:hypothetical protein [Thalassospira sp. FZY0004]MDG4721155.1 hypothetical protein [Thalassospira sp. FZY0004]
MPNRARITDFTYYNSAYINATVAFYLTDEAGARTETLAPLYAGLTGSTQVENPQRLGSRGKFTAAVYHEAPIIGVVESMGEPSHETGVIHPIEKYAETVAGISAEIQTVAGISGDVETVAGNAGNISTVSDNISDVNIVAEDLAGTDTIGSVAENIDDIGTVSTNINDIGTVVANMDNVTAVADISDDVQTVAGIADQFGDLENIATQAAGSATSAAASDASAQAAAANANNILALAATEPAWRTPTETALFMLSEPGQPVPAPLVHTRTNVAPYIDKKGHRAWAAAGEVCHQYDEETLEYLGADWSVPSVTTYLTHQMFSGAVPGVVGSGGALPTGWSLSQVGGIQTEVVGVKYHKGFKYLAIRFSGTPDSVVFRLAYTGVYAGLVGEKWTCQARMKADAGSFTNIDKIGIGVVEATGPHTGTYSYMQNEEVSNDFEFVTSTRTIENANPSLYLWCGVFVPTRQPIDITLWIAEPQVEKSAYPGRFVGADETSASKTLGGDTLTIGPVETGANLVTNGTFDSDLSGWSERSGLEGHWASGGGVATHPSSNTYLPLVCDKKLTVGKRYRIRFDLSVTTGDVRLFQSTDVEVEYVLVAALSTSGAKSFDFTATREHIAFCRHTTTAEFTIDNVEVVELIPFEGWDSDANGHAVLMDVSGYDQTDGTQTLVTVHDHTNDNLLRMWRAPGVTISARRSNADIAMLTSSPHSTPDAALITFSWDDGAVSLIATDGTHVSVNYSGGLPPAGLCRFNIGATSYLAARPLRVKRFAVYNRKLAQSDLESMVLK